MGNWAKRRRNGGSIVYPTIAMIAATNFSGSIYEVTFNRPIDERQIPIGSFRVQPAGIINTTRSNLTPTSVIMHFVPAGSSQTTMEYLGGNPNFVTPQSITIS